MKYKNPIMPGFIRNLLGKGNEFISMLIKIVADTANGRYATSSTKLNQNLN